jgi:outer membrane receptor protein involved in Fe transport
MSTRSVRKIGGLCVFVAYVSICAVAGLAQQAASTETPVKLEKYVVTGSHIPMTETSAEAQTFPVVSYDRSSIEKLSYKNTAELLQKISFSNGGAVPISNNATATSGPLGATSVSLRGLGPEATLVLINGRRVAQFPAGGGATGASPFVDLNSIPVAAIERVEILKDGASSTYGADAVAGVVNIILRKNYSGTDVFLSYGNTTNRDSSETTASFVSGSGNDKTQITVGFNYYHRAGIMNHDRSYSANPDFKSSNSSPENIEVTWAAAWEAMGLPAGSSLPSASATALTTFVYDPVTMHPNDPIKTTTGATVSSFSTDPRPGNRNATNNGLLPATAYSYFDDSTNRSRFNFNEFSQSLPRTQRESAFFNGESKLFGTENIKGYYDFNYSKVFVENQLAPLATGTFTSPNVVEAVIPARTANPLPLPDGRVRAAAAGAYNPFNPFNIDLTGGTKARLAEFDNRILKDHVDSYMITAGIKADNLADKWNFDAGFRYSDIKDVSDQRLISASRFNSIVNANDPIFNPSSPTYVGTTIPYNPFGYFRNPIANNAKLVSYAQIWTKSISEGTMLDATAVLSTNDLFAMPGGGAGFALGYEYRNEQVEQSIDGFAAGGDIFGNTPTAGLEARRKVGAVFAELSLPLFTEKNAVTGVHDLSLNLAARNEQFMSTGKSTTVPKIGVKWQPLSDNSLTVRASAGKGYREPSLFEQHAGISTNLTTINDPITKVQYAELTVTVKGNPHLAPETSKSYNFGVVWSPKNMLNGFTTAIDWWQIEREGTVVVDFQNEIDRESQKIPGGLDPGESVVRSPGGVPLQVNGIYRNQGKTIAKGIDFSASYAWKTQDWGRFDLSAGATYMYSFLKATTPGQPLVELIGTDASVEVAGYDGYLKWKGRGEVAWSRKRWSATVSANYTDGFIDLAVLNEDLPFKVKSTVFCDVQLSYDLGANASQNTSWYANTKLTVGANNVLDKDPPYASGDGANAEGYPSHLYNSTGRFLYVSLEKKF